MKLYGDRCQCAVCLQYFSKTSSFDKHRYGPWEDRKCTHPVAMAINGWKQTSRGFWMPPPNKKYSGVINYDNNTSSL